MPTFADSMRISPCPEVTVVDFENDRLETDVHSISTGTNVTYSHEVRLGHSPGTVFSVCIS